MNQDPLSKEELNALQDLEHANLRGAPYTTENSFHHAPLLQLEQKGYVQGTRHEPYIYWTIRTDGRATLANERARLAREAVGA
jgi:hypothetical protein